MTAWTVGVCGFGRCGSTMVMGMLAAGGCPPVDGAASRPFETSPRDLRTRQPAGRAIKLLDTPATFGLPPADGWRFVWLDRDPVEQARSIVKFLGGLVAHVSVPDVVASLERDRPRLLGSLRAAGPVLVLSFERVLVDPRRAAKQLRQVWPGLDVDAAAAVVHERGPRCLPGLGFELSTLEDGAA